IKSQIGAFRHRRIGLKYRLSELKKAKKIIPFKRKRLLVNAPIEYKIVQKQRRKIRKESLEVWLKYKDFEKFEEHIEPFKADLREKKLWYQRVQAIRRK